MSSMSVKIVKNFLVILRDYINGMECAWIMKITLKLNIGNYQSLDIESDDLPTKANCYEQICRVIKDWEDIADHVPQIIGIFTDHIPDLEYPIEKLEVTEEVVKPKPKKETTDTTKKGKYQWFPLAKGGKVRTCNNEPCPYYLKWDGELGTYQHGKYDTNSKIWSFVDDQCEFYKKGG